MKKMLLFSILFLMMSCSKKEDKRTIISGYDYSAKLPYDTTATDSFSEGATPENIILNRIQPLPNALTPDKKADAKLLTIGTKKETGRRQKENR